jgi:hypothetical protein
LGGSISSYVKVPEISMFGSVIMVVFQNVFYSKKYVNNIFLFLKNYF